MTTWLNHIKIDSLKQKAEHAIETSLFTDTLIDLYEIIQVICAETRHNFSL